MPTVAPLRSLALSAALAVAGLLASPALVHAGCGCDHPPPDWAVVMPPFGTKGKTVTVHADTASFVVGATYTVEFGSDDSVSVQATEPSALQVTVPSGVTPGPVALRVHGQGYDYTYPDSAFTALAKPRKIKAKDGVFKANNYELAISSDGTAMIALDMKSVLDATQFVMAFLDLPLVYGAEDVVIYNADGVDLTLFTSTVTDPVERQWGSYYGWTVEGDSSLQGDYYVGQSHESSDALNVSNLFTYWRHEFYTYAAAHAPGGTHEVDAQGLHPDGTVHIDHSNLVIAISGVERSASAPFDLSQAQPLQPGMRTVDLAWISVASPVPVEISALEGLVDQAKGSVAELLEEVLFAE